MIFPPSRRQFERMILAICPEHRNSSSLQVWQVRKLRSTPLRMKNIGKYWRRVAKKSGKSLSRQGKVVILQADYYQGTQKSPIFSV